MSIILGSQSPRREEILRFFSIPFTQAASFFDEESVVFDGNPKLYVEILASKKAESLSNSYSKTPILTADTTVFCEGKLYNKPKNREEAVSFLMELSGKWHSVYTGMALFFQNALHIRSEETKILFCSLSLDQIHKYLDHVNFLDKAGGYAIQQGGSILVKKIEGSYHNVMGLPLEPLKELLEIANLNLWDYLKIL